MTLPYTPLQAAVRHVEEDGALAESLEGMPVVCCSLHSQLAPACAGIGEGLRVAYVQLSGGALPVSLSDSLRALKKRGLVELGIAAGACFDGDAQAVGVASALAWAQAEGFAVAVCAVGPGIVGTASALGHGAWPPPRPRMRRARSAARRCLRCACPGRSRERHRASPTTLGRSSTLASAT